MEYDYCVTRIKALVLDLERSRQNFNHLEETELYQYLLCVVVNEVNDILHLLHDTAEDRVIRGEKLIDEEVNYITVSIEFFILIFVFFCKN